MSDQGDQASLRPPLAWVIGRSGLLGSHLVAALMRRSLAVWAPPGPPLAWTQAPLLAGQLREAVAGFRREARRHAGWLVLWSAGASVVGSSAEALAAERESWARFLSLLEPLPDGPGAIFLASSAGGVHGGATAQPITEDDVPRPISAYGEHKLAQEEALASWAAGRDVRTLIGRLSNLYGPGQNLDKPQGLISQLCRGVILNLPVHLYVPADTIRDYLFAEDAARDVALLLAALLRGPARGVRKIIAAELPTTLASAVRCVSLVGRRPPRLVWALDARRASQPARLIFHSLALPEVPLGPRTSLLVGAARVYHDQLARLRAGGLGRPH